MPTKRYKPSPRALEAQRLRHEEDLTYQEIGNIMGITRQGAHLLVNPDKHRAYQRTFYWRKKGKGK